VKVQLKPLSQQAIVITGATSGIGLATARMAAKRGAKLALAARNEEALHQLEGEINAGGGQATASDLAGMLCLPYISYRELFVELARRLPGFLVGRSLAAPVTSPRP